MHQERAVRVRLTAPFLLIVPEDEHGDDWRAILAQRPFVRYDRASFGGRQVELFLRRSNLVVDDVVELDDLPAALGLVRAGVGVAILPIGAVNPAGEGVRTIMLDHDHFHREIGIVTRSTALHNPDIEAIQRSLLAGVAAASARLTMAGR